MLYYDDTTNLCRMWINIPIEEKKKKQFPTQKVTLISPHWDKTQTSVNIHILSTIKPFLTIA